MFILEAGALPKSKIQATHVAKNQFWFRKGTTGGSPEYVSIGNGMVEPYNPAVHNKNTKKDEPKTTNQEPTDIQQTLNRNSAEESRLKLFTGQEKFIGTAGSATGETFGIIAAEQVLSGEMDKFFSANGDKIEEKLKLLDLLKGSSKKAFLNKLEERNISKLDYARMMVWVDEQFNMLKQYESNPESIINKLGHGELKDWLEVAYWTGVDESSTLKNNPIIPYGSVQPPGYPVGVVVNAPGRQAIQSENAGKPGTL
jgi:hypothetical protein